MCVICEGLVKPENTFKDFIPCENDPYRSGAVCPDYLSVTYYEVVIGSSIYKGWKSSYSGIGKMTFIKTNDFKDWVGEDSVSFYHDPDHLDETGDRDWMKLCWEDFISFLETKER